MSSFNRRSVLGLVGLGLTVSACGFTPVYRDGAPARGLRGAVLVDAPEDRVDFNVVRAIEDRFGRPTAPVFGLSVAPVINQTALAVQGTSTVTRYNLVGTASYALRDLATDTVLRSGQVETFTSYSATGTPVATDAAERDARRRLAIALADLIVTDLLIDPPSLPSLAIGQ